MVTLISDGGQMTVGRRLASHVWGQFSVTLPEGEKQQDPDDDRIVDGYVYRPDDAGRGRAELTFMRADAKLDMNASRSDLEATLDGASRRTEGDVFYSREISGLGLGRAVPGVDYTVGDVVSVLVWGRRLTLPVTAVTAVSDTSGGAPWRVQVGGQVLRDAAALRKRNDDLQAQIAVEKRQRLRQVGTVDRKATRAQSTADTARGEVAAVRDTLAGEQSGNPDLLAQLVAVNEELQRLGQDPQPSLMLAFISLSTALWEAQQKINAQQLEFNKQQEAFNEQRLLFEKQQEDIDASQFQMVEQIADVQRKMVEQSRGQLNTVLISKYGSSHPNFPVEKISDTQWACTFPTTSSMIHAEWYTFTETTDGAKPLQIVREDFRPGADRIYQFNIGPTDYLRISWGKTPIVQRSSDTSNGVVEVTQSSWQTLGEHTVQVGKSAEGFSAHFRVLWNAVNRGSLYGVRIVTSAGAVLATTQSSTFGPLGPLGNGRLSMSTSCSGRDVGTGESVYFQVYCSAGGPKQRRIYSGASQSTWVEDI